MKTSDSGLKVNRNIYSDAVNLFCLKTIREKLGNLTEFEYNQGNVREIVCVFRSSKFVS